MMPGPRPLSGENAMRRIGIPNVLAALTPEEQAAGAAAASEASAVKRSA